MTDGPARLPLVSVALISGAALGMEILLTRAFAIVHWHHFASMIVGLALLGFGASGTFLTLTQSMLLPRLVTVFPASMVAFGVTAIACPLVAQRLPLQAEALLWDPWQPLWVLLVYVTLAVPFFCAAAALGLALSACHQSTGQVYAADLAGAGLGSVAILAGLNAVPPETLLRWVAAVGGLAALVGAVELRALSARWLIAAGIVLLIAIFLPAQLLRFEPGSYKALTQALTVTGSRILLERSSALGRIDVVDSARVPLRLAPGLSLAATGEPPRQLGLFTDGDSLDAITAGPVRGAHAAFLRESTGALGFVVAAPRSVLVTQTGGGLEVLRAHLFGSPRIDALELDPRKAELLREDFAAFTGFLIDEPGIDLRITEPRGWLQQSGHRYDVIVVTAGSGARGGTAGMNEDYLLTREALDIYLDHLQPGGFLSIAGDVQLPPRAGLKIVAMARAALEVRGTADLANRMLMVRGWQTWTLLIKNGPLTGRDIARTRDFAQTLSFDLVWHPGLARDEANVFNQLAEPFFYDGVRAILGEDWTAFLRNYAFDIEPATDDRPYFHDFFRWEILDDVIGARERGGMALLESGYLLLVFVAVQALLAGTVLIILPLAVGVGVRRVAARRLWRTFGYFAALGFAFLFLEIAFLQKVILLIHEPTTAFALTLAIFLIGAGLGSAWSARTSPVRTRRVIAVASAAIIGLASADVYLLDRLNAVLAGWSVGPRSAAIGALLLPLTFCMGVPFPTALRRLDTTLVPWAWGINGCASVLSAAAAALLAAGLGLRWVVLLAIAGYALAPLLTPATDEL